MNWTPTVLAEDDAAEITIATSEGHLGKYLMGIIYKKDNPLKRHGGMGLQLSFDELKELHARLTVFLAPSDS